MNCRTYLAGTLLLSAVFGCQPQAVPSSRLSQEAAPAAGDNDTRVAAEPAPPTDVAVTIVSWKEVQEMVSTHRGKVVVIDLWSTWCVPCVREFPNLVKLHEDYPNQVACISVNVNYDGSANAPPESYREEVFRFLARQRATFQNVICSDSDEQLYSQIDLGAVPAIYIYGKDGQLRKRFDNDNGEYGEAGFTYENHVTPLVEQLLTE